MRKSVRLFVFFLLAATGAACEITKTETPLSPSVAGPIAGVEISAPKVLEPASGAVIPGDRQPLTLLLENASSNGQRPLSYTFEVATDGGFSSLSYAKDGVTPGENGRTSFTLPTPLGTGRNYFWRAKAQDGANSGPYSASVAFNLFTPVTFDKPVLVSPVGNAKVTTITPELVFNNAPRAGSPGTVSYVIEVASNSAFAGILSAWTMTEQGGSTRFTTPSGLPYGTQLYWRARAFESSIGPWSDTATFTTPAPPVTGGGGGGGGTGGGGASCTNVTSQLGIVQCRRSQVNGTMDAGQLITFLRNVASDLNKAGTWGAGYGLLRKSGGGNCGGYSCDIICRGNGTSQQWWDVLLDSDGVQTPVWGGPNANGNPNAPVCE